jgi:hypothetical protein
VPVPDWTALRPALHELSRAFAALAEAGDVGAAQLAALAARALVTGIGQPAGPNYDLIARLVETCAADTLRFTRTAGKTVSSVRP